MDKIPTEQQLKAYLEEQNVEAILTGVLEAICFQRPSDVPRFIVEYMTKNFNTSTQDVQVISNNNNTSNNTYFLNDEKLARKKSLQPFSYVFGQDNDHYDEMVTPMTTSTQTSDIDFQESENIRRRYSVSIERRNAVSNESIDVKDAQNWAKVVIPKTDEERKRLQDSCAKITLLKYLDKDELSIIYDAMFAKTFEAGEIVIQQGTEGDNFYVVDSGICEIWKQDQAEAPILIKTAYPGDSFGELALIFGTPRAATVTAKTECKLWAIDRITYRKILMKQTQSKRKLYQGFLKNVSLLQSLTDYERDMIADALVPEYYPDGSLIVSQGEQGDSFFFVVEGEVVCLKDDEEVNKLGPSSYFGELALLHDQPRACSVKAIGEVKIVKLDRNSFKQLLGPVETILKRSQEHYKKYISQQSM